eukprot:3520109-Rhodomonas_salina.1
MKSSAGQKQHPHSCAATHTHSLSLLLDITHCSAVCIHRCCLACSRMRPRMNAPPSHGRARGSEEGGRSARSARLTRRACPAARRRAA